MTGQMLKRVQLLVFAGGCSCKLVNGGPCHKSITPSEYRVMRDECMAFTHNELDLVVMGQLRALTQNDDMIQKVRTTNTKRIRPSTQFQLDGHRVCIDTFCFLHCMSQKRFKSIILVTNVTISSSCHLQLRNGKFGSSIMTHNLLWGAVCVKIHIILGVSRSTLYRRIEEEGLS